MDRRGFFSSLVAQGATVTTGLAGKPLKHRKADKAASTMLYHGPMEIPEHVASAVAVSPDIHRTRGGGRNKLAARHADGSTTWLFRCQVPTHRQMVGEIVRTPEGSYRVHCWSAATPAMTIRPVEDIILAKTCPMSDELPVISRPPIGAPPLAPIRPDWKNQLGVVVFLQIADLKNPASIGKMRFWTPNIIRFRPSKMARFTGRCPARHLPIHAPLPNFG